MKTTQRFTQGKLNRLALMSTYITNNYHNYLNLLFLVVLRDLPLLGLQLLCLLLEFPKFRFVLLLLFPLVHLSHDQVGDCVC